VKEQRRHDSLERNRRSGAGDDAAADEEWRPPTSAGRSERGVRAKGDPDANLASAHARPYTTSRHRFPIVDSKSANCPKGAEHPCRKAGLCCLIGNPFSHFEHGEHRNAGSTLANHLPTEPMTPAGADAVRITSETC
jgi:hypothetical protein